MQRVGHARVPLSDYARRCVPCASTAWRTHFKFALAA